MSYDVSIGPKSFNYTSNVGKFFYDHIPPVERQKHVWTTEASVIRSGGFTVSNVAVMKDGRAVGFFYDEAEAKAYVERKNNEEERVQPDRGGLHAINGMTGREAHKVLSEAFDRIEKTRLEMWEEGARGEPAFCAKYDAPNGWGSVLGAIVFLSLIMAACAEYPDDRVEVCA